MAIGSVERIIVPLLNVEARLAPRGEPHKINGSRGLDLEGVADALLASQTTLARYDQNPGSSFEDHFMSCMPCRTRLLLVEKSFGTLACTRYHYSCIYRAFSKLKDAPTRLRARTHSAIGSWKRATTLNFDHTDEPCSWRFADHQRPKMS